MEILFTMKSLEVVFTSVRLIYFWYFSAEIDLKNQTKYFVKEK